MFAGTNTHNSVVKPAETRTNQTKYCVNCQGSSFTKQFDTYDFDTGTEHFAVESCDNCHLIRTSPVLDQKGLSKYYHVKYYGSATQKFNRLIELWTIWANKRLARKILQSAKTSWKNKKTNPKVLDIGCGRANLLKAFHNYGCKCYGVERSDFPDDHLLEDISIYKEDFLNIPFEKHTFDIIVFWHVLEHLSDPVETIKKAQQILKPDGILIVAVPNFSSIQRILFKKNWFHLDVPRHTYHFDQRSINSIFLNSGLHVTSISTSCIDQSIFGFIQSTINLLNIGTPNKLYSILKSTQKKPKLDIIAAQLLLASTLIPIAFFEYILSVLLGRGACLILQSVNYDTTNTDN